jgi:valyl-tRNA synthetase
MIMLGLYLTGKVPFGVIHLHARVVDRYGQKMSKSRGNVINPIEMVNKYGADALRMALVMGVAPAGDIFLTDEKVRGMRNFANKLWNTGRFIYLNTYGRPKRQLSKKCNYGYALIIRKEIVRLVSTVTSDIEKYHFGQASEKVYQYVWHKYCDVHLEKVKPLLAVNNEEAMVVRGTLLYSFLIILKLLHPYMPFVTEELHSLLYPDDKIPLVVSSWPKS